MCASIIISPYICLHVYDSKWSHTAVWTFILYHVAHFCPPRLLVYTSMPAKESITQWALYLTVVHVNSFSLCLVVQWDTTLSTTARAYRKYHLPPVFLSSLFVQSCSGQKLLLHL